MLTIYTVKVAGQQLRVIATSSCHAAAIGMRVAQCRKATARPAGGAQ